MFLKSHPWAPHKEVEVLSIQQTGDQLENLVAKDEALDYRELLGFKGSRWHREVSDKHRIREYWSRKSGNVPKNPQQNKI